MSFFGEAFSSIGTDMLHGVLGDDQKAVAYLAPPTTAFPNPDPQPLTNPIIGDLKKSEADESKETGNQLFIAKSITFKRSEISRLSNKGAIVIDGIKYPMLNMIEDEDCDQVHCDLDHSKRTNVTNSNFVRAV